MFFFLWDFYNLSMLALSTIFVRALVLGVVKLQIWNFIPSNHKIKSITWDVIFKKFCNQAIAIFFNQAVARWYFFKNSFFIVSHIFYIISNSSNLSLIIVSHLFLKSFFIVSHLFLNSFFIVSHLFWVILFYCVYIYIYYFNIGK